MEKQKPNLQIMCQRRGLMICDVSFLLGYETPNRIRRIEKGKAQMTLDEAIKIAHILDVEIDEIHCNDKKQTTNIIRQRAIILAKQLANKAYLDRFKKRLLWLNNYLICKNKNNE